MLPTISVVIPTYNGEAWIADTLKSVFDQTQLPSEIIVVDDASTDGTAQRVTSLIEASPVPVKLIQKSTNSGSPAPTLNTGLAHATGELVAVLDQDDFFLPTKLERQARALSRDKRMSLVFSLYRSDTGHDAMLTQLKTRSRVRHLRRRMTTSSDYSHCEGALALEVLAGATTNFFGGFPGFMFRRSDWVARGGFDEGLEVAADFEFLCWLCTRGSVGFIAEAHYVRREHGANLTVETNIRWRLDAIIVLLRYADYEGSQKMPAIVRETVHRHLWAIARRLASAGHRRATHDVSAAVSMAVGRSWRIPIERLAIPAYVAYYRLLGRPWKITANMAEEATALAKKATRLLAEKG